MKKSIAATSPSTAATNNISSIFNEIVKISNRTAEGVIAIGKLLVDFENSIVLKPSDDKQNELEEKLINEEVMAASTISCYRTIGACKILSELIEVLPPYFNHIYTLSAQEKKQPGFIRMKADSGELNRTTTLSTIRSWISSNKQKDTESGDTQKIERNGRLMLRVYIDESNLNSAIEQLSALETSTNSFEVDYSEVEETNKRSTEKEINSARRAAYVLIKEYASNKKAELKKKYSASVAKENFTKIYSEVAEFLEFNSLSSVVSGQTSDEQFDSVLDAIGSGLSMKDFYQDAL